MFHLCVDPICVAHTGEVKGSMLPGSHSSDESVNVKKSWKKKKKKKKSRRNKKDKRSQKEAR